MRRWVSAAVLSVVAAAGSACGQSVGQPIVLGDAGSTTLEMGLVGYWKLDEMTADEPVLDSSGHANSGTPINQPSPSSAGAPVRFPNLGGRAFDGVSQLIDLGNPTTLDFEGEVTLAAWVYLTAMPVYCGVIVGHGYRRSPDAEVALRVSGGTCDGGGPIRWSAGVWTGGLTNQMAETSISTSDVGLWIHLAGTHDGRAWHLYKNGIETSVYVYASGAMSIDAAWGIGGRAASEPAGDPRSLPGRLDDVRIYDRALSPSEILDLYHL